ncbi:MAG: hypothetical protein EA408_01155 [Marinilabiliales bacterium]|nr:MAG: hypothetical protein EA408_01155 [Marinilabiliales bacterium]
MSYNIKYILMEAIILQGGTKSNIRLILELAKKLDFKARKLSLEELEDLGIALSISEGVQSGYLDEKENTDFIDSLNEE